MKHLIAAALIFAAGGQARAEEDPNYFYSVSFSSGFAVTRYAKPEYADKLKSGRSNCVVVNWAYASKDENNLDDLKSERERASEAIAAELSTKSEPVVAATTLGGATGLWVIYTGAGEELANALDGRLRQLSQSKYRVRLANDSEWSMYAKYVERLREKQ